VIDYYSIRKSAGDKEPEFRLDVRPASDSFGNIQVRLMVVIERVLSLAINCPPVRNAQVLGFHILKFLVVFFLFLFVAQAFTNAFTSA
jgi:hypothetical protein